ncbi:MAG: AI-2E family transporter, partial [Pirellulaceae bacterium]|nr:AI-2E family transporter [Pirellulaceae bacterium]
MTTRIHEERVWLVIGSLMVLATATLAVALVYAEPVMVPFVLAIFIVTIVSPIVDFLVVRWRFPHSLAIAAALTLVLAIMAVFAFLLYKASMEINAEADKYSGEFLRLAERSIDQLREWNVIKGTAEETLEEVTSRLIAELKAQLPSLLSSTLGTATNILSVGLLVIVFVVFMLAGRKSPPETAGVYAEIERAIRRYSLTKFLISTVTGILVGGILWLFGLPMAGVFGMLAFLLNFIPSIGSIVATLLPIPVAMARFEGDFWMVLLVVAVPGAIQLFIGNAIEPKLMGKGLELHPVTILLALVA